MNGLVNGRMEKLGNSKIRGEVFEIAHNPLLIKRNVQSFLGIELGLDIAQKMSHIKCRG